jgi:hypothetical protein
MDLLLSILNCVNLWVIAFAMTAGLIRFRQLDSASRMIWLLTVLVWLTECLGRFAALRFQNNRIIYDVYSLTEFIILALYFNHVIRLFRIFHIGRILAIIIPLVGICNFFMIGTVMTLTPGYLQLQHFLVILMSLSVFLQILLHRRLLPISRDIHFWISCALLFSSTAAFVNWGVYDYFTETLRDKTILINYLLLLVSMITYLLLGFAFYRIDSKNIAHARTRKL